MQLEIYTPERKVFRGQVYGVKLPGIDGFFEVLENHAPLVAALVPGKMKVLNDKTNFSYYTIKGVYIEVLTNQATVLVEGAVPATEKQ
jgi:F-type H+-transporting ATPase subunit epsilon